MGYLELEPYPEVTSYDLLVPQISGLDSCQQKLRVDACPFSKPKKQLPKKDFSIFSGASAVCIPPVCADGGLVGWVVASYPLLLEIESVLGVVACSGRRFCGRGVVCKGVVFFFFVSATGEEEGG